MSRRNHRNFQGKKTSNQKKYTSQFYDNNSNVQPSMNFNTNTQTSIGQTIKESASMGFGFGMGSQIGHQLINNIVRSQKNPNVDQNKCAFLHNLYIKCLEKYEYETNICKDINNQFMTCDQNISSQSKSKTSSDIWS